MTGNVARIRHGFFFAEAARGGQEKLAGMPAQRLPEAAFGAYLLRQIFEKYEESP
jgi:hypothetical protein